MLTRVNVDDDLLEEARQLGKHGTTKEAAIAALKEYVDFHRTKKSPRTRSEPASKAAIRTTRSTS